jgi:hypothetical protein
MASKYFDKTANTPIKNRDKNPRQEFSGPAISDKIKAVI